MIKVKSATAHRRHQLQQLALVLDDLERAALECVLAERQHGAIDPLQVADDRHRANGELAALVRTALGLLILCLALVGAVSCGGGNPQTPTAPGDGAFLSGTWHGTIALHREGEPDTIAPTEWTLTVEPNTGNTTYATTFTLHDRWLAITAQMHTAISPPSPGGTVGTAGEFESPRGCTGFLSSLGTATERRIEASFHGIDCMQLPATSVFTGELVLTR
jgi:hypothetical protein